jgi:cation:H+ antiporter
MIEFTTQPLVVVCAAFAAAAAVIGLAGWHLASVASRIAERTGLGQAITGAVFLGASTSLSGTVTSVTAAADGHPELAFANAIGGISAQTAFLAIADLTYARANLEHAAASAENMMQGALLVVMLGIILVGMTAPEIAVFGMHPASLVLPAAYVYGLRFAVLAAAVGLAGWVIARASEGLSARLGHSETAVGAVFSAVSTSLPELVTCIAAVRQGALTLAVGDIIGGNVYDTLFVSLSDLAYRDGSILHAAGPRAAFVTALPVLLTWILLMSLVRREQRGIANIGFESFLVLLLYLGAAALMLGA